MTQYRENDEFVRDLKEAAHHGAWQASEDKAPIPHASMLTQSRAAMLALIDQLARRGLPVLSLIAIGIVAIAGFYTLALPAPTSSLIFRLVYWLLLALGSLFFTAHRLRQFRQGLAYNGRPFRWRAHYTATLAVLSTAIGSGAILLTPAAMPPAISLTIIGAILLLGTALGLGHLAHRATALSASLPALTLVVLPLGATLPTMPSVLRDGTLTFLAGSGLLLLIVFLWARKKYASLIRDVLVAHPRQETLQVTARQKKVSTAYNPFSFRMKEKTSSH